MSEQTNLSNVVNDEQYVDWPSLRYYDQRIKDYIRTTSATKEETSQLQKDLDQLEELLISLNDSFVTDKKHIYDHIADCISRSATKDELNSALEDIRAEINAIAGVDLSRFATTEYVDKKIAEVDVELPEGLVTEDALQAYVAEEIAKIEHPTVDLSGLATKEALAAVEEKIPSVEGLASESYVDEKVVAVEDHESRIGILEYNYQAQSQLHAQRFDSLQEQDTAIYKKIDQVEDHVSEKMDTVYAEKTFAGKTDLYNTNLRITNLEDNIPEIPTNISTFTNDAGYLTSVPEGYVTDEELAEKGYLTEIPDEVVTEDELEARVGEFQSTTVEKLTTLETNVTNLTETNETLQTTVTQVQENVTQVSTQVTELEQNIQNNYITIENGVTRENLEEAVKTQVETEIDVLVDEKIAEVVEQGVTVSSIAYGEF